MNNINNVKISVLFHSLTPKTRFVQLARARNVSTTYNRNFVVIKDVFSITVFQNISDIFHINVTGIRSLSLTSYAIDWLKEHYCRNEDFSFLKYNIDNITASFNIGFDLHLNELAQKLHSSKYNSERFPGLHLKVGRVCAILFKSGKINILGCKTGEEVMSTWIIVQQKIKDVAVMKEM